MSIADKLILRAVAGWPGQHAALRMKSAPRSARLPPVASFATRAEGNTDREDFKPAQMRGSGFGVPHLCGSAWLTTARTASMRNSKPTSQAHPNPGRNRAADAPARYAWPPQLPSAPDIPLRCSIANPSNAQRSRVAPDCDERSSASPRSACPNASCARRRERKPFSRVNSPRRSKRARCGRATAPIHAAEVLCPALQPARDNDSAAHTTRKSDWHGR